MKKYFKEFLLVFGTSVLVGVVFILYMVVVGIPKTQANNYYNMAITEIQNFNPEKAEEYLMKAKDAWNEVYIEDAINVLKD